MSKENSPFTKIVEDTEKGIQDMKDQGYTLVDADETEILAKVDEATEDLMLLKVDKGTKPILKSYMESDDEQTYMVIYAAVVPEQLFHKVTGKLDEAMKLLEDYYKDMEY